MSTPPAGRVLVDDVAAEQSGSSPTSVSTERDGAEQDSTEQDGAEQDSTEQDSTAPDSTAPRSRRERREAERSRALAQRLQPDLSAEPEPVAGALGLARWHLAPALELAERFEVDSEPAPGDAPGPPPRPAPHFPDRVGLNGPFDAATGLFRGPAEAGHADAEAADAAEAARMPPAYLRIAFTPPEGNPIVETAFAASAFRGHYDLVPPVRVSTPAVEEAITEPSPPTEPPEPEPEPEADPLAELEPEAEPLAVAEPEPEPLAVAVAVAVAEPLAVAEPEAEAPPAPAHEPIRATRGRVSATVTSAGQDARWPARIVLTTLLAIPAGLGLVSTWLAALALILVFGNPLISSALLAVVAISFWALIRAARAVIQAQPAPLLGGQVRPREHPRLWMAISEVASGLGVTPLERIVVDGGASVAVTWGGHERELVIGLPLLVGLDRDELCAVVAHELAHEVSTHPTSTRIYQLGHRLEMAIGTTPRGLTRLTLTTYAHLYRAVATAQNRHHELRADDQAARICGRVPLASAIHRTETVRLAWQVLVDEYLPLSARAHRRPALCEGVRNILAIRGPALSAAALHQTPPPRGRFDAHLPATARIARLRATVPGSGPRDRPAAASSLLDGGEHALAELERSVLLDDDPEAGWDEIVARTSTAEHELTAARLTRAAQDLGHPEPVSLETILAVIAAGSGPAMVDPLLRPAIPAARRAGEAAGVLRETLGAFVTLAMLRSGQARYVVRWDGPATLQRRDLLGEWMPWELDHHDGERLVSAAAASPAQVAPLRAWLQEQGVHLGLAVDPAPEPPPLALSALADLDLCGTFDSRRIDLLVYSTGLLLAPAPANTALRSLLSLLPVPRGDRAGERIVGLAERLGEAPAQLPTGWWIPLDMITNGRVLERRIGLELQLRLKDGAAVTLRASAQTASRGTPLEDLSRLLPGSSTRSGAATPRT